MTEREFSRRDFILGMVAGGSAVAAAWDIHTEMEKIAEGIGEDSVPNLNPDEEPYDDK